MRRSAPLSVAAGTYIASLQRFFCLLQQSLLLGLTRSYSLAQAGFSFRLLSYVVAAN